MKKYVQLLLLLLLFTSSLPAAVVAVQPAPTETVTQVPSRSQLEDQLGRKLKFKERVALKLLDRQQQRALKKQARLLRKGKMADERPKNGMAVASFVCGVVGIFAFGVVLGTLAIVFGVIGIGRAKREGKPLRGLAIAGLVLGIIGFVGALVIIAAMA